MIIGMEGRTLPNYHCKHQSQKSQFFDITQWLLLHLQGFIKFRVYNSLFQIKILQMLRILVSIALVWQCFSRVFQTSMKFSQIGINEGWIYLDKMSFAPGTIQFQIRTQLKGIPYGAGGTVTVQAIPEYLWQHQKQVKCKDVPKEPYLNHQISVGQSAGNMSRKSFISQKATLYYFVMKDCQRTLQAQYQNNNLILNIQVHLINNDKQTGEQEDHWLIVPVILIAGVWLVNFYNGKMKGAQLRTQRHKMIMFAGIATQISSLTWKTFGFVIYVYTGSDYNFFHFIYLFMHSTSQSLVIGLIILIGIGWTISYNSIKLPGIYVPIAGGFALINALLTIFSKLQSKQHDRHHTFDNWGGDLLAAYHLVIAIVFLGLIYVTYGQSRAKVRRFIIFFALFGGLYISALPIVLFIGNNCIQAKDRHEFVFVAMEALKCTANIVMSIMLNHQRSYYNQISYENRSFVPQESSYF